MWKMFFKWILWPISKCSEQIKFLICGLQASHRVYLPNSLSEHFALQNVAWQASHRVYLPDSLSEHFALQNVACYASHRIYLSDSPVRTFNFVESHTSCVRFIFRFTKGYALIMGISFYIIHKYFYTIQVVFLKALYIHFSLIY